MTRIAERRNMSLDEAATFLARHDRQRRALIESIFHKDLSDWSLYDMVLNTNFLSMELVSELIYTGRPGPGTHQQGADR